MKKILLPLVGLALAPSLWAQEAEPIKAAGQNAIAAPAVRYAGKTKMKAKAQAQTQLFTADVADAIATVWSDNFDNGISGWTFDPTSYVTWNKKTTTADKAFSSIDPTDKGSLYVEGPYQTYRREISSATSGSFDVPHSAKLTMWVGMSKNYDDVCRLIISISDDDFTTSTDLWNSKDAEGENPWAWRPVSADLAAWAGKTVKLRLTYSWSSKDETFKTGGYMGDFTIDDIKVSGVKAVTHVDLTTGEKIRFVCLDPAATGLRWSFPGGVPAQSTEAAPEVYYTADGSYDVTLTAKIDGQDVESTVTGFATVTGTAPVAKILPPSTFRDVSSHNYLVAPLAPVTFRSASTGFPTEHEWVFAGITDDNTAVTQISGPEATVSFMYQHSWPVGLAVANDHGSSSDLLTVTAEYQAGITNTLSSDIATTFDMSDWGVFPGSNTHKITRYAEYFSAPSVPVAMAGAYLYFVDAPSTISLTDNTMITVSLYTCENGLPGKRIDFGLWDVIDINGPTTDGSLQGTFFEFSDIPSIAVEFFIVIDGLPEYRAAGTDDEEDLGCLVSFAMAQHRAEGNTAYMEIDGQWRPVHGYFEQGKGTSFFVTPVITHSVLTSLPVGDDEIVVSKDGGDIEHQIFSIMGYETPIASDADWCEAVNEPNGYTVDTLILHCQPNTTGADREAHLTVTDGLSKLNLTVRQSSLSGISDVKNEIAEGEAEYYNLQGIRVTNTAAGQTLIRRTASGAKTVRL